MTVEVRKSMKRPLSLVVLAALVLGVCAAATAAAKATGAKQVTLKVLWWGKGTGYIDGVHSFEKQTGIKVQVEQVPFGDYQQKVGTYQAAGHGPDVMWMENGGGIYNFAKILRPLNKIVPQSLITGTNGQDSACVNHDCQHGSVLGITQTLQAHPWYYNKVMLASVGITKPPTNFQQLATACDRLIAAGKDCIAASQDYGGLLSVLGFWQDEASIKQCAGLSTGTNQATEKQFVLAYSLWKWLSDHKYLESDVKTATIVDAQAKFSTSKAAFFVGLLSDASDWATFYPTLKNDFGAMLPPRITKDFPIAGHSPGPLANSLDLSGGISWSIAKWSNHVPEAVKFIQFMSRPGQQLYRAGKVGAWPAAKSINPKKLPNPAFQDLVPLANASKGACWPYVNTAGFGPVIADTQLLLSNATTPQAAGQNLENTLAPLRKK